MKKKVLVLVDYQNDFTTGSLGFEGGVKLDDDPDGVIIATLDSHREDYLETQEGRKLPIVHCMMNTEGHKLYGKTGEFVESLYTESEEFIGEYDKCVYRTNNYKVYIVTKDTFGSIELAELLRQIEGESGIECIEVAGIVTNMCVASNVVIAKAACSNVEIKVQEKYVDSFDRKLHIEALNVMEGMQVTVVWNKETDQ